MLSSNGRYSTLSSWSPLFPYVHTLLGGEWGRPALLAGCLIAGCSTCPWAHQASTIQMPQWSRSKEKRNIKPYTRPISTRGCCRRVGLTTVMEVIACKPVQSHETTCWCKIWEQLVFVCGHLIYTTHQSKQCTSNTIRNCSHSVVPHLTLMIYPTCQWLIQTFPHHGAFQVSRHMRPQRWTMWRNATQPNEIHLTLNKFRLNPKTGISSQSTLWSLNWMQNLDIYVYPSMQMFKMQCSQDT